MDKNKLPPTLARKPDPAADPDDEQESESTSPALLP